MGQSAHKPRNHKQRNSHQTEASDEHFSVLLLFTLDFLDIWDFDCRGVRTPPVGTRRSALLCSRQVDAQVMQITSHNDSAAAHAHAQDKTADVIATVEASCSGIWVRHASRTQVPYAIQRQCCKRFRGPRRVSVHDLYHDLPASP